MMRASPKLIRLGAKLVYSTLFGGNGNEATLAAGGIAFDSLGNIFVGMDTKSTDLTVAPAATPGPFQSVYGGGSSDGFLAVFQPVVTAPVVHLKYCTYLGINAQATVTGVAVDSVGNAYLAGYTSDPLGTLATTNGFQTVYGGGPYNGFVMKILPSGMGPQDLSYGTFLGGSVLDQALAIAVGQPVLMMSGVAQDYCLTSSGGMTATVTAGGTAGFPMAAQAQGFNGAVALTCTATVPQGVCSVTPASVMLSGVAPVSFQVSVTTTAAVTGAALGGGPGAAGLVRFVVGALGVLILCGLMGRASESELDVQHVRGQVFRLAQAGVVLVMLSVGLAACFGGPGAAVQPLPGTPAGTYPLTVTGTAAGATRTVGLTLTVQ
jgi:hypothetical protein